MVGVHENLFDVLQPVTTFHWAPSWTSQRYVACPPPLGVAVATIVLPFGCGDTRFVLNDTSVRRPMITGGGGGGGAVIGATRAITKPTSASASGSSFVLLALRAHTRIV